MAERKRGSTATSHFGVSRRESHDATAFYQRFELPVLSDDDTINPPGIRDRIVLGPASDIVNGVKLPGGVEISFSAVDPKGRPWLFEVVGGFSSSKPGLNRADLLWKTIGKSATVAAHHRRQRNGRSSARLTPLVILTTAAPPKGSAGAKALDLVADGSKDAAIRSVVTLLDPHDLDELRSLHLDR